MKTETSRLFAVAGLLSIFSSAAIAGAPLDGNGVAPGTPQTIALEKMIRENAGQKLAAEAQKYARMAALAGDRQDELAKRKSEAVQAYKTWQDSKSAAESSRNANAEGFKAVDAAAQAYSRANRAFVDLQQDILAKNGVSRGAAGTLIAGNGASSDPVGAFNAAPPTAAGTR